MSNSRLHCAFCLAAMALCTRLAIAGAISSATITYDGTPAGGGSQGPFSGASQAQAAVIDGNNIAKASADFWTLKTYASLDLLPTQSLGHARAAASFSDLMTISSDTSGPAILVFNVVGTLAPGTSFSLGAFKDGIEIDTAVWSYEGPLVDTLWGFPVYFETGVPFEFTLTATSDVYQTSGGTGLSTTDFFNSVTYERIELGDETDIQVAGASGFAYVVQAPEPSSLALIGSAFFLLLRGRARRPRRAVPLPV